ncbi:MAG TPA: hypothetical protein DHV36_15450 [Desulfobacteraceae bacterium]|nr:hypothetical protein [Desulfobacteraceae bacterium]
MNNSESLPVQRPVYCAFGLSIASEISFPDMLPVEGRPDIFIRYGRLPKRIPNARVTGLQCEVGPGAFLLRVGGIAGYYVTEGRYIIVQREAGATDEEVLLFLMGSAMGALLHQRNILPLHAGAVRLDGGAVLFMGLSGIGKSTMVARFQDRGYSIMADDVCAVTIDGGKSAAVAPGFPLLKLGADVLKKLDKRREGLRRVRLENDFKKYFVPFDHRNAEPAIIRSVFLLQSNCTGRFEIEKLAGMDKIEPFLKHTYRTQFLEGQGNRQIHFQQCSVVAAQAPVYKVKRPRNGFRLQRLMDLIERHW